MPAYYKAILSTWWSEAWAKAMLSEFTPRELAEGCRLLSDRCFMSVTADGKGPLYFDTGSVKVKLRLSRLSPREKSAARKIVLQDGAGSGDLQKGIMNEALWAALRREGLSPELTDRDELSSCSGRPERGSRFYQAAALLCAGLLVSSDPALMFAWRGLSLYDDLNIPRLPARHLPNGNEPAVVIRVPAAWRVLLAEAESRVLPPEGRAIAERWAPEPYALAWLVKELPLSADLRAAEALAPRLHGFTLTDSGRFRELRASLELPDGKA